MNEETGDVKRVTTRVRGLAPWQPQRATRELLDTVRAVLVGMRSSHPEVLQDAPA